MSTKIELSPEEEEILIEFIQNNSILYDPSNIHFKNAIKKDEKWKEISDQIGLSVEDCKIKWRSLRDYYQRLSKKPSASGVRGKKGGALLERLSFLPPSFHVRSMISTENASIPEASPSSVISALEAVNTSYGNGENESDFVISSEQVSPNESFLRRLRNKRKKIVRNYDFEVTRAEQRTMQQHLTQHLTKTKQDDKFDKFFASMADIARTLDPQEQIKVMPTVSKLMGDLEELSMLRKMKKVESDLCANDN